MLLIRADANEMIGTGHIMRCLSIASAFSRKGEEAIFVTADHKSDKLIANCGFNCICLDTLWTDMNGEIPKIENLIKQICPSILIVDSYYVTKEYFLSLSKLIKTCYIDDLNKELYNVDVLINYNIFSSVFDYSAYEEAGTKLLLGAEYAPLRTEFRKCPKYEISDVTDVLVSAGGSDPERITEQILKGICSFFPSIHFHFVVGALNPRLEEIKRISNITNNSILHINEQNMSKLMMNCDIAISASGITLYELCACGIPTITFTLADNQLAAAAQFTEQGIMLSVGDCRKDKDFIGCIKSLLHKLVNNVDMRLNLSSNMQLLVDGNGADRVVEALED